MRRLFLALCALTLIGLIVFYPQLRMMAGEAIEAHERPPQFVNHLPKHGWGKILNPSGALPDKGFYVWLINTANPGAAVRHDVSFIGLDDDFPTAGMKRAILASGVAFYWVARLSVPEDGLYRIVLKTSTKAGRPDDLRFFIDGREWSPDENGHLIKQLDAGEHRLEVEYLAGLGWQTFTARFAPTADAEGIAAIRRTIDAQRLPADTVVFVANVYRGSWNENELEILAPPGKTPYITVLDSREAVHWRIRGRAPQLVLFNHAAEGSTVASEGETTTVAWHGELPKTIRWQPYCYCQNDEAGYHLVCPDERPDGIHLPDFSTQIQELTGFPLAGMVEDSWTKALDLATIPLIPKRIEAFQREFAREEDACVARSR